jgi:hypothetical protein
MKTHLDKYSQILDSLNNIHGANESICSFLNEHQKDHSTVVSNLKSHIGKIGDKVQ